MASSNTVLRPRCVKAEHSRYFTESVGRKAGVALGGKAAGAGSGDTQVSVPYARKDSTWLLLKLNKHISGDQRHYTLSGHISLTQTVLTSGQSLPAALDLGLPTGYPCSQSRAIL